MNTEDLENLEEENPLDENIENEEPSLEDSSQEEENHQEVLKEKNRLKRALYSQAHKLQILKQEKEQLLEKQKELRSETSEAQKEKMEYDLNRVKARLAIAAQENNALDLADANVELSKLSAKMISLENDEEIHEKSPQNDMDEIAHTWASLNEDIIPGTPSYNPNLSKFVSGALNQFHQNIQDANQQHLIGTVEYWNVVDQINEKARHDFNNQRQLNVSGNSYMQPARGSSPSRKPQKTTLTREELKEANFWGVSPEAYLKAKQREMS